MQNSTQIAKYLEEVTQELATFGINTPFHLLITGGAFMMLQQKRDFTYDIDFALLEPPAEHLRSGHQPFAARVQRAELASARSSIPFAAAFRQAVSQVAARHSELDEDWLNDEAAEYVYEDAPQAEVVYWRSFGGIVYTYLPTPSYMLALKIAASREKDLADIQVLLEQVQVRTRKQAQAILDQFLLPEAQRFWQVKKKLKLLFPSKPR